jgi:hypothetical protein
MLSRTVAAASFTKPLLRKTLTRSLATQASQTANGHHRASSSSSSWKLEIAMVLGLSTVTATSITLLDAQKEKKRKKQPHFSQPDEMVSTKLSSSAIISDQPRVNTPPPRPDLPIYTREEVAEHCDEDSLWYTFRGTICWTLNLRVSKHVYVT